MFISISKWSTADLFYYATECLYLAVKDCSQLPKCSNSILWKIVGVNDGTCVNNIQKYFGNLPINVETDDARKGRFPI